MNMKTKPTIGIIGTGDYGRALGRRLVLADYDLVYGSRFPQKRDLGTIDKSLAKVPVKTIEDSIECDITILAISVDAYLGVLQPLEKTLSGRIVVDVSNKPTDVTASTLSTETKSNAEVLSAMLPNATVVKAFNTISAYNLESESAGESRLVQVCGQDQSSKDTVSQIVRDIGFSPVDCGGIQHARVLERLPHQLFPSWAQATRITLQIAACWFAYAVLRYHFLKANPYTWDRLPVNTINKGFACTAITLLALCFLPGCVAAIMQLRNGTKYKRFPRWLDTWLKIRKPLGLYGLLMTLLHMVLSLTALRAAYYPVLFHFDRQSVETDGHTVVVQTDSRMNWVGETCMLLGVMATAAMSIIGITSLPSVASSLNWREWRFVQSQLGWLCLCLATAHVTVMGVGGGWHGDTFSSLIQKLSFLCLPLPWLTLLFKFLLLAVPGLRIKLEEIRRGYEPSVGSKSKKLWFVKDKKDVKNSSK